MKTTAVVVWFHPSPEHATNLLSYVDLVDSVVVIDNTPTTNAVLLPRHPGVSYLPQHANLGLGKALNVGFQEAKRNGSDWVLSMDQDSSFDRQDLLRLLQLPGTVPEAQTVAIFAPSLSRGGSAPSLEYCDSAITSGSLIRVAAHAHVAGHNERLFVDDVDHEFGYRLRRAGFKIVRAGDVFLHHRVGDPMMRKVLWRKVHTTNHSALRKYYMTRNRLYMRKHYADFGAPYLRMVLLDAIKVVLIERDKARKLRFMAKGAVDYLRGIQGELR